jgi:hypothetical protein
MCWCGFVSQLPTKDSDAMLVGNCETPHQCPPE